MKPGTVAAFSPKTFAEFVEYAKQNPGKLNYGSSGAGTSQHLAAELFQLKTGAKMTHVPFRSSQDIVNGLIGGHIDLAFDNMTIAWPQAQGGTVRALAVTSPERSQQAPEIPTVAETLPGFDGPIWIGMMAPTGTPKDIVERMNREVTRVMTSPAAREWQTKLGSEPMPMTPAEFAAHVRRDIETQRKWITEAKIKVN